MFSGLFSKKEKNQNSRQSSKSKLVESKGDLEMLPATPQQDEFDQWLARPELESLIKELATQDISNIYSKASVTLQKIERDFIGQLEAMLDPEIFEREIVQGKLENDLNEHPENKHEEKEKPYRYSIDTHGKEKAIFYYKIILNLLRDAQKFLIPFSKFHQQAVDAREIARENIGYIQKYRNLKATFSSVAQVRADFDQLLKKYLNLYNTLATLKLDEFFYRFSSAGKIFNEVLAIIEEVMSASLLRKELKHNSILSAFKNQIGSFKRILHITEPAEASVFADGFDISKKISDLLTLEEALGNILVELVGKNISEDSLASIIATNQIVNKMVARIQSFTLTRHSFVDVTALIRDLYPHMKGLLKHSSQSYLAIQGGLKNNLLDTAQQINIILQELFLKIDQLELKFYLKEGYLFSLLNTNKFDFIETIKDFNVWMQGLGYVFRKEERFPYSVMIEKSRKELLAKYEKNKNLGGPYRESRLNFLKERLRSIENKIRQEREQATREKEQKEQQEKVEASYRYAGYKIKLIPGKEPVLDPSHFSAWSIHLYQISGVLQGVVKKNNQLEPVFFETCKIRLVGSGRVTMPAMLPNTLYFYLVDGSLQCFVLTKNNKIESVSLDNLPADTNQALQSILTNPQRNYSLPSELRDTILIKIAEPLGYFIGEGLEEKMAAEIRAVLDEENPQLTPEQNKAIYQTISKQKSECVPFVTKTERMLQLIDSRITELTDEINKAWFLFTSTKKKKILILEKLRGKLNHASDSAVPRLYNSDMIKKYCDNDNNIQLLLEGRTGEMVNKLRYLSVAREDEATLIENIITKQLQKKSAGFWFFAAKRHQRLAREIIALKYLKKLLIKPGYYLKDALEVIKIQYPREFSILNQNQQPLLGELKRIEAILPASAIGKKIIYPSPKPNVIVIDAKNDLIKALQERLNLELQKAENDAKTQNFFIALITAKPQIKLLKKKIACLKEFAQWLSKPGYYLENTLKALKFSRPQVYGVIFAEKQLIKDIKELEETNTSILERVSKRKVKAILKHKKELRGLAKQHEDKATPARKDVKKIDSARLDIVKCFDILAAAFSSGHPLKAVLEELKNSNRLAYDLLVKEGRLLKEIDKLEHENHNLATDSSKKLIINEIRLYKKKYRQFYGKILAQEKHAAKQAAMKKAKEQADLALIDEQEVKSEDSTVMITQRLQSLNLLTQRMRDRSKMKTMTDILTDLQRSSEPAERRAFAMLSKEQTLLNRIEQIESTDSLTLIERRRKQLLAERTSLASNANGIGALRMMVQLSRFDDRILSLERFKEAYIQASVFSDSRVEDALLQLEGSYRDDYVRINQQETQLLSAIRALEYSQQPQPVQNR